MGRMGGGGQEQQAPRDHIMIGLLSIRAALDAMIDPLTPYCEVMNRIKNQPGAIKELLHGIQLEGAHQNGVARERAKKWREKVRKETGKRHNAARKMRYIKWRDYQEILFKDNPKAWVNQHTGRKHTGPGGAALPRNEEGGITSVPEGLVQTAKDYSPDSWCPGRVMEAPTHLDWYEEALGEQLWADGSIYSSLMAPITVEEVDDSLKASRNTAPGPSGLTTEAWKQAGVTDDLTAAFNEIITRHEWPEGMLDGLIFPIAKRMEGLCTVDNARPIALLETILKVLTRILGNRWTSILNHHPVLERNQMAFVPGVNIMENIEVDSFLWEWCRAHQGSEEGHLHAAYLDCSKAYDSISGWLTTAAMKTHKLPPDFIDLVVRLDDVPGGRRVVTEVGLTARISFSGMAQGEILSPKKFVVSQDPLVRWLSKHGRGKKVWMKWGGRKDK